jgi:hypothetical protein
MGTLIALPHAGRTAELAETTPNTPTKASTPKTATDRNRLLIPPNAIAYRLEAPIV